MNRKWLILVVSLAGAIVFYLAYSNISIKPDSERLRSDSSKAKQEIFSWKEKVASGIKALELATSYSDQCYEGQNNFKVHSGYTKRCSLKYNFYYGFNNFQQTLLQFEDSLLSSGWKGRLNEKPISAAFSESTTKDVGDVLFFNQLFTTTETDNDTLSIGCASAKPSARSFDIDLITREEMVAPTGWYFENIQEADLAGVKAKATQNGFENVCVLSYVRVYFNR